MNRAVSRETPSPSAPAAVPADRCRDPRHGHVSRETEQIAAPAARPGFGTRIALAPIRVYRRLISPMLGPHCRYYPSCSSYAEQAIRELGPVRGALVGLWRLLRCNPLSSGGLDPLENRRLFRSDGGGPEAERPEVPA